MKKQRKEFNIAMIKRTKKEILEELFPKEASIAFHSSNCKILEAEDSFENNLYRFHGLFLSENKKKDTFRDTFNQQEYYIFATRLMLFRLSQNDQWFIDGAFDVVQSQFKQLLIILVYIPKYKVFYPVAYITLTGKSEAIYLHALCDLNCVSMQQELPLKPLIVMSDFEVGLRNAITKVWSLKNENVIGCYFHFVNAIRILRALTLW